jgi:hypothetical protein
MSQPWDGVGEAAMTEPYGTRGGFWWGEMLTLAVKPQWVHYKLEEMIAKPCSDFLAHTSVVCKGIPFIQQVFGYQG